MFSSFIQKQKVIIDFFIAYLLICILYRITFFTLIAQTGNDSAHYRFIMLSSGLITDLIVGVCLTMALGIVRGSLFLAVKNLKKTKKITSILFDILLFVIFIAITIILLINQKIFSTLFIGLNYTLVISYLHQGLSFLQYAAFTNYFDIFILSVAISLYCIVRLIKSAHKTKSILYGCLFGYAILSVYGANAILSLHINNPSNRFIAIYDNPINQITTSFIKSLNPYNASQLKTTNAQMHSIALIDPSFLKHHFPMLTHHHQSKKYWNIVIFVLESTGANYIFDQSQHPMIPMPFLKKLSSQGLWFENHYTGGNISALGQFSIFTGLYPNPSPAHFELQENLAIPTVASWLGKHYDSFLVSASNNLYFAMGLNKTFSEYDNANIIQPDEKKLYSNMFLDEPTSHHFFLQRLEKAKPPFLGVYWSGATHYPYKNYASQQYITHPKTDYARYLNNLHLLDHEIQQTYQVLKNQHRLENTIFIGVGDHGEMFGQHGNILMHGRSSYQEEIKVPLLIYAPKLFSPHKIQRLTSSIDILPTLLEIMQIPYGSQLQGESLLHASKRKYIFIYNDQDEVAAIDQYNKKMNISFSNNACTVYDIKNDSHEQSPMPCQANKQQEAILKFRHFQPYILNWYNLLQLNNKSIASK